VDADHATGNITRRSRTGFLVYLNNAPVYWFSKKQTSVETSSFGSEFAAMKQCTEYIRGLRYKLRMMGIPVSGDFHNAYNLMALITGNPAKTHIIVYSIGRYNGDAMAFLVFVTSLIDAGFSEHNEALVMPPFILVVMPTLLKTCCGPQLLVACHYMSSSSIYLCTPPN
jgi:hypothetical protein